MRLVYAKNCDIYYDSRKGMIVFSKRGLNFVLRRSREDMEIIKEILRMFYKASDIDKLFEKIPEETRKKYYAFAKLLWQKNILVEELEDEKKLSPSIRNMLISNYDSYEELVRYWSGVKVVYNGCEDIADIMRTYGISCKQYSEVRNNKSERLYIGSFNKKQCKRLLNGKSRLLLYRESEGTSYIMYMDHFDEEKYDRYWSFVWKGKSRFYAKNSMVPIHMFMHCSNCISNPRSPELLCITGDGTIHSFAIGNLYAETATYFNRDAVPVVTCKEAMQKIEDLAQDVPYLVEACNKNNNDLRQSPICNYEVVFGSDFGNKSYLSFHESYEKAALNAFSEGLEKMLGEGTGNTWACGINKEDYYAKGYITLLENRNQCYEITSFKENVAGRIRYLEDQMGIISLKVYYRPSPVEGVGAVILCDEDGYILHDGTYSYDIEKSLLEGIYKVIGEKQIQQGITFRKKRKLKAEYSVAEKGVGLPEQISASEAMDRMQKYFGSIGKIIDEKIWAYQAQIQDTGMHVGKFYFVR